MAGQAAKPPTVIHGLVPALHAAPHFCPALRQVLKNPGHPATLIVRAGAAGVMLALAFIHVQLDGATQLADLYSYAFAPVANIIGVRWCKA